MISKSLKLTLLAASAGLVAGSSVAAPSVAAPLSASTPAVVVGAPEADETSPASAGHAVKAAGLAAIAAGVLAFFNRRRLAQAASAAGRSAVEVGKRVLRTPAQAFRAAGRAVGVPLRNLFLAIVGVIALLTGIDLLDVEWTAGLVAGAAMALVVLFGWRRLQATARFMVNGN